MSREGYAKFFLARFLAQGITGGGARRMDHRVSAGFSRWTSRTPSSAYQHGSLD